MKKNYISKTILSIAFALGMVNWGQAQCSFTGLDDNYCSDADPVTLVGTPAGGVFDGPGITGDQFSAVAAGSGDHTINYKYTIVKANYYLRAAAGEPWSSTSNTEAMDLAFGAGAWTLGEFESIVPSEVFSDETGFVYIDGSDNGADELATFLAANLTIIEAWVNDGGRLLLNAAPNEGGDITFGFGGSTLVYADASSNVTVVDVAHPAFLGPNTPTIASMSGGSYSHAHITGTGFTNLVVNSSDATNVVLCEKAWGAGQVMMGGMTTTNFHSPLAEAGNWRANILYYLSNLNTHYYLRATAGEPWGSTSNPDAMNLAFGNGQWTLGLFESLDPAIVFSSSTEFIFIDGSDNGAAELNTFLGSNMAIIEEWVNAGGTLLLNAAPNEGGDINFGFDGSTLVYADESSSVDVVDLAHPAYLGPNTPTAATMTGGSYSHAHITGTGFTSVLVNSSDATNIVLCEKAFGDGNVMMGGMTTTNYHSPSLEANNWRANLMVHMSNQFDGYVSCIATQDVTVFEPIVITYITGDELFGDDGSIDVSVTGGTPAYLYDWDNDGTGDFDDTEDLSGLAAGTYIITVEDDFGCTATETIVLGSQVGIETAEQVEVKLYPNPTHNQTVIEVDGQFSYQLFDLNGKLILVGKGANRTTVDLSAVENGVYLLKISSDEMNKTIELVKQ